MKISTTPTDRILVKAYCQSEWDFCDFALITCDDYWIKGLKKKMEATEAFDAPDSFVSFKFYGNNVEFYQSKDEETELLPGEKEWDFVTLGEGEEESLDKPGNRLSQGFLNLYRDGSGFYEDYGKNTNEEFYTAILPFKEILKSLLNVE